MRTFKFDHNDYVTVTLTKEGAEFLNEVNTKFYDNFPKLKRGKCDYKEGDEYRTKFWALISCFSEMLTCGSLPPFEMGDITVESSLEN